MANADFCEINKSNRMTSLQVRAKDKDATDANNITYSFSSVIGVVDHPFRINEHTGNIYLKRPLDFEITPMYTLTVQVSLTSVNVAMLRVCVCVAEML